MAAAPSDPVRVWRKLAQMNRLANHRLHRACPRLSDAEYGAARAGFFPSIRQTLNHILLVDRFYIPALEGGRFDRNELDAASALTRLEELAECQAACDARLLALVGGLAASDLARIVVIDRGDHQQRDRLDDLLSHLFQHQTHHRGQVHAMLASTSVPPPQLDEFILADDAAARAPDMAALGWTEAALMED